MSSKSVTVTLPVVPDETSSTISPRDLVRVGASVTDGIAETLK